MNSSLASRRHHTFLMGIFFFVSLISFFVWGPLFRLTIILCQVGTDPCPPSVIDYLGQFHHQNLFFLQPPKLSRAFLRSFTQFESVQFSINPPHTLRAEIAPRIPVAQVVVNPNSPHLLVDHQGAILNLKPDSSLPTIYLATPSSSLLNSSLNLEKILNQNFIPFESISISQPAIFSVKLKTGQTVIFTSLKNFVDQVNSLQYILQAATISEARIIDVRFDKPVLSK